MRTTLLSWLPQDLRGAPHPRRRLRHRRTGASKPRAAVPRWWPSTSRPPSSTWRASACPSCPAAGMAAASTSAAATCSTRRWAASTTWWRWTRSSTTTPPMPWLRVSTSWPQRTSTSMLFTFAPRTPLLAAMIAPWAGCSRAATAHRGSSRWHDTALSQAHAPGTAPGWLGRRPRPARGQRLLHLAGPGTGAPLMNRHVRRARSRPSSRAPLEEAGPAIPALCRRRHRRSCRWAALMRLSMFQVTVGMCTALMVGTLNRVMIVELGVARLAGGADGGAAHRGRALPRPHRPQAPTPTSRPSAGAACPTSAWARLLHVRRPGHHALRAAAAVGPGHHDRPGCGWATSPRR